MRPQHQHVIWRKRLYPVIQAGRVLYLNVTAREIEWPGMTMWAMPVVGLLPKGASLVTLPGFRYRKKYREKKPLTPAANLVVCRHVTRKENQATALKGRPMFGHSCAFQARRDSLQEPVALLSHGIGTGMGVDAGRRRQAARPGGNRKLEVRG